MDKITIEVQDIEEIAREVGRSPEDVIKDALNLYATIAKLKNDVFGDKPVKIYVQRGLKRREILGPPGLTPY